MYKCPHCDEKFTQYEDIVEHLDKTHSDAIPKNFTPSQYYYALRTGKDHGSCIICKMETGWNEATKKYKRFCEMKKCKDTYRDEFKKRMIGKYGKVHMLNDPDQQKKMLANRSISGKYKWSTGQEKTYTGSYEEDAMKFLDIFMEYDAEDIFSPSPHVYYYEYEGEKKFYMPDMFIASLNLELEFKDGGDNPNNHHKIQAVDKAKEKLKDDVMSSQTTFSYVKIVNKNYGPFFDFLGRLKKQYQDNNGNYLEKPIVIIPPDKSSVIKESSIVTESIDDFYRPVFILLTYTDTSMAKLIRFMTNEPYSHASISFDSSMTDVYSFGRKQKDDPMKFINEDINEGVYKEVSEHAEYSVYTTFVTNKQYMQMQKKLKEFKKNKDKLTFGFVGLFNIAIGKETSRENEFFCSQFVAEILRAGIADNLDRDPSLYSPYGLTEIENTHFVARGKLKNYDQRKVDQKVKALQLKLNLAVYDVEHAH